MATPARPEGVEVRTVETPPEGTKVPKRRFGRTEIQMPILTCGGCVLLAERAAAFPPAPQSLLQQ